jgi:hypothetical protein
VLELEISGGEYFDEEQQKFITIWPVKLKLEHSLISVSKWESEFEKPFLGQDERTREETVAYVRHMCLGEFPPGVFSRFTAEHFNAVNAYINKKMTATTVTEYPGTGVSRQIVTSELIYYWMVAHNIPSEYESWHLNRLLTLIKVCNAKNQAPKKMSPREAAMERHRLNQQRKAATGSRG